MAHQIDTSIKTLGELKQAGYQFKSIKEELRDNLIAKLQNGENIFSSVVGYEDSVIPDMQRAVLSRHDMILLGLRGQAKTRIARLMTALLDDYIPIIAGSEINDDPLHPISAYAREQVNEKGDDTPIEWVGQEARYAEKLATPDVSVADLIGDIDPVKAANLRLPYSDERVLHYGLVPRSNRSIFVINELPDLQPRIQVALFNILQEGDVQIRGFKLRLPLDIQFIFTANPEDYTNRGTIVTPLKDRIQSQILTHYPNTIEESKKITKQEARITEQQKELVDHHQLVEDLAEQIAFEARESEYVDSKSGVSARLTISAFENLYSAAERRVLINREDKSYIRIADFWGVIPSITGKIELVYEGEQEGPALVAQNLIGKAVRTLFPQYFPNPENIKKDKDDNPYKDVTSWFEQGNVLDLLNDLPEDQYEKRLKEVKGLEKLVDKHYPKAERHEKLLLMEFLLHGLAEYSMLSKNPLERGGLQFKDLFSSVFSMTEGLDDEDLN